MQIKSFAIQRYWSTDYQKFSEKLIEAIGLFSLFKDFDKNDVQRLYELRDLTNKDVRVPIYKIDRVINPSKGKFDITNNKFRFNQTSPNDDDNPYIELTEAEMQYYCCLAIEEVHCIVLKNISKYAEEIPMPDFSDDEEGVIDEFEEVSGNESKKS